MKYKTLFRNLCKLLGIFFVITGCSALLNAFGYTFAFWQTPNVTVLFRGLILFLGPLFELAAGLFLLFKSNVVTNWAIPGNRPYCPECGYDLTGSVSSVCPECGIHPLTGRPK